MKYLNQKGYSLVLTLVTSLTFVLLAMVLLSATMGGFMRTEIRQEVIQVEEVTEKGLDFISQEIQTILENQVGSTGLPRNEFITKLNQTLNQYVCSSQVISNSGETGDYSTCISKIDHVFHSDGSINDLRKRITLRSLGTVNGRQQTLETTMEVGSKTVPDALRYVLGAHDMCESSTSRCTRIPGEGNMFLHGGVDIQGDMKVDGDLITTNRGYAFFSGSEQWIHSLYPVIRASSSSERASLVLGGQIYTFNSNPTYATHISRNSFNHSTYTNKTHALSDAFSIAPQIVAREPQRDQIDITSHRAAFSYSSLAADYYFNLNHNTTYRNYNLSGKKAFFANGQWRLYYSPIRNLILSGNNTFGNLIVNGNLQLSTSSGTSSSTFENGLLVTGNLVIGNQSNSYQPTDYAQLKIDGPIYVDGDLLIKGADAELNALIYVNGNVIIENSRLNGLNRNGREGSLIVFSKGTINIRNNSVDQPTPSNIRGFFYSEDALELFGVGSNIKINGGISARRIVLNGVRGLSDRKLFPNSVVYGGNYYFNNQSSQMLEESRLQVIYNRDIINTYADLKAQEPVIMELDKPQIINRKILIN